MGIAFQPPLEVFCWGVPALSDFATRTVGLWVPQCRTLGGALSDFG
jgi:hypothetical protein